MSMDAQIPVPPEVQEQLNAARRELERQQTPTKRTRATGTDGREKTNRNRWAMLNRFVDSQMRALPVQACACWLALFRHADASGRVARSLVMLERDTGLSRWAVRKGIKALEANGLVRVELKGNNINGKYTTTCYKLEK